MSQSSWPPALKAFVNDTFSKCTDANRTAVEAELKGLIFQGFENHKLWTIDWASVKLESLKPKKRKTTFVPNLAYSITTVAGAKGAKADESDRRDKRAKRFVHENGIGSGSGTSSPGRLDSSLASRLVQGGSGLNIYGSTPSTPEPEGIYDPNVIEWDQQTIVGTSSRLEKPFLRLTSLPDPTTIRPLPVLEKTLDLLKLKWREEGNYGYICDQFKSMRQDLTVQRIKNDFTCSVYEIHGRIALEKGDLGEFNQCQGQLRELYKHGLAGHVMEFLGYRILYLLFSRNRAELNSTLANLTLEQLQDPSVIHAIAVRQAVSQGNYTKFFRLFNAAPKMGAYLMDHFVPRERVQALVIMTKAYQQLPVSLIYDQLAFDSTDEVHTFLSDRGAAYYKPTPATTAVKVYPPPAVDKVLDCKLAHPILVDALAKLAKVDLKGQI